MVRKQFAGIVLLALMSGACHGGHEGHGHESEETGARHIHDAGAIVMEPTKARAAGVETDVVVPQPFRDVIQTSGKVTAASCDESTIASTVTGLVVHAHDIGEGMPVRAGATLFYVSSSKLQDGDVTDKAYIELDAARSEYERMKPLAEERLVTEREFYAAKAAYEKALLAYKALGEAVAGKGVPVKSPVTGYVKECYVKDGDYVEVGTPLMEVTRNQHLYLRAEVPVRYYQMLGHVRSARFRTQYSDETLDLADMNGQLLSLGKTAVSSSSYIPVTFQFDNNDRIVPGAYAEVFLITGVRDSVISLPQAALTEEQGLYYVYVREGDHSYYKREVVLGATDGKRTEIVKGVRPGEHVVVKGAVSVRLAGAANAIPGHSHNH